MDVFEKIQKQLDGMEQHFANEFLARVQRRTPVISGTLRDGWKAEVQPGLITIRNEVPYAGFVEYGTSKMAPRAMLRTTIEEAEQIAAEALRKAEQ